MTRKVNYGDSLVREERGTLPIVRETTTDSQGGEQRTGRELNMGSSKFEDAQNRSKRYNNERQPKCGSCCRFHLRV